MRSLRYSHLGITHKKGCTQAIVKFLAPFSKCKSCNGNTEDEEQKMFTSQKCYLPVGISAAHPAPGTPNASYVIANKPLQHGVADEAPPATIGGPLP
jgi:hypothetical protein